MRAIGIVSNLYSSTRRAVGSIRNSVWRCGALNLQYNNNNNIGLSLIITVLW